MDKQCKEKLYKKNLSHEIRIYQKVKTCEIFHLIISRRRTIFGEKVSINYLTLKFLRKEKKSFEVEKVYLFDN